MKKAIEVEGLSKDYKMFERKEGMQSALKHLFVRKQTLVHAVQDISFSILNGEKVAFLGPNGSGKTTTLKMLSGLLHPTSGEVRVLRYVPYKREPSFLKQISMVMGNRQQLHLDIPIVDSFELHRRLYGMSAVEYRNILNEYIESFELSDLLTKTPRTLSLGQRMRCELALSLLHRPKVMFLDEPTLGLDLAVQSRVRECIREVNEKYGTVVLLTSHYMADVISLCQRIIFINSGSIIYDGPLNKLVDLLAPFKLVEVQMSSDLKGRLFLEHANKIVKQESRENTEIITFRVHRDETSIFVSEVLSYPDVFDFSVSDPPIEYVIDQLVGRGNLEVASK
ncbi:ABC transporter ATP-binding protein [Paenibacillus psychroresistens]|nr:ATP-binding cassette domain-containing protein [Paenibacillus psychroresistens]